MTRIDALLEEFAHETAIARKHPERLPDARFDWQVARPWLIQLHGIVVLCMIAAMSLGSSGPCSATGEAGRSHLGLRIVSSVCG